jgi:hypothetical protein
LIGVGSCVHLIRQQIPFDFHAFLGSFFFNLKKKNKTKNKKGGVKIHNDSLIQT